MSYIDLKKKKDMSYIFSPCMMLNSSRLTASHQLIPSPPSNPKSPSKSITHHHFFILKPTNKKNLKN